MNRTEPPAAPWYRESWAWLVFGLPATTVVACAITIWIAVTTSDGLVVDDYYKQGLEINRVLDRDARAAALGLTLSGLRIGREDFSFTLSANDADSALPATITVGLAHATRDAGDQSVTAEHLGAGRYRGRLETLTPGPWYVDVATAQWRLMQRVVVAADGLQPAERRSRQ